MKFLLDTNICIFVIRNKSVAVIQQFEKHAPDDLAISSITLAELRFGAAKSANPPKNQSVIDAFAAPLSVVPFDADSAATYGDVRADLESSGTPIGPLDTMIAAQALTLGIPLVTNNAREFSRVRGLVVEDWTTTP